MKTASLRARRPRSIPSLGLRLTLAAALAASALACKVSVSTGDGTAAPSAATRPGTPPASEPVAVDPVIDVPRMLADLETLSGDDYRGRYTFSENLGQAADLLAKEYRAAGLAPVGSDYRVSFMAAAGSEPGDDVTIWVEDAKGDSRQVAGETIVTLSNGQGEPAYADTVAVASLTRAQARRVRKKIVVATAPDNGSLQSQVQTLGELEPAGLVLIGQGPSPDPGTMRKAFSELAFPVAWLEAGAAKEWMGVSVDGKAGPELGDATRVSMAAKSETIEKEAFNVLAQIPGSEHPEQIVMLGAHYDHIGTVEAGVMCRAKEGDEICNGADDNASGTAMVLEIARAFADANVRPARTIVFAHFAGEELGLLGSEALANEPPAAAPFAGGEIVAMVNLDMVGRLGEKGLAIGGVGSSDAWMPLLDELGPRGMAIVYERAINGRSDHANFYRRKVPVLFFFTGLHDDYHRAGDHFDKINREGMASIGQLVADLVHQLGGGRAIAYAPPRNDDEGVVMRMPGSDEVSVEKRSPKAEALREPAR